MVPLAQGSFGLDDYVGLPARVHPAHRRRAPARDRRCVRRSCRRWRRWRWGRPPASAQPRSLVLMGGPLDTPAQPDRGQPAGHHQVPELVRDPPAAPGAARTTRAAGGGCIPGSCSTPASSSMNPMRHMTSHWDFFQDLVRGDLSDAEEHRRFYDEYNAVLDMPAEYYLDCIRVVFQQHLLPRGQWHIAAAAGGARRRSPARALLTIEGELDDISGAGPDPGGARAVHGHTRRAEAPPDARRRRPLRHVQRPALARDGVSPGARVHRGRPATPRAPATPEVDRRPRAGPGRIDPRRSARPVRRDR